MVLLHTIKLLSISTTYPESLNSPKAKFVHILNKNLDKLGVKVTAIAPHSKNCNTKQVMDNVLIKRFRYLPKNSEINYQSIAEAINESKFGKTKIIFLTLGLFFSTFAECIRNKPDIIHGHWAFPAGYVAALASKFFGSKYVVSIHGGEIPLLKKFKFIQKPVIKALNTAACVIVNSNYSKEEFEKLGVKKEKLILINPPPNFVKHTSNTEQLKNFRNKLVSKDTKIILYYGRLTERKGVEHLIRALPELKTQNVHLIIAGGGGKEENLKKLSASLQLDNKIIFFGRASDDDLGLLHDISDVFVCPSIIDSHGETEALGLVIPEAMESKLPVIGSNVGGIPDIIKNEINGLLIAQKDPNAIAHAIDRIFSDEQLREKLVKNSQETVKEFLPEIISKKHYEIFEKILKN